MADQAGGIPRRLVWLLTLVCGVTVANLYYTQPLLHEVASGFHVSESDAGLVVTATQVGYAVALVLLVPLGDIVRQRPLVCGLLIADAVALAACAGAPTLQALTGAGLLVGITSVVVQILVPFAATLAADHQRNRVIGTLLSGMLLGVLLSRTFAGVVSGLAGWRTVYALAAVFMLLAAALLYGLLGTRSPELSITYRRQMRSIASLAVGQPVLRRRSLIGALIYGAFNCFWTTAAFLLTTHPYHFSQGEIGLFGLVGVAGALTTNVAGRHLTASRQVILSGTLLAALVASFAAMALGRWSFVLLVLGVLVMDAAVQGIHLLNQSVVYGLLPQARARLTVVYMTSYFIGGGAGSAIGSLAYRHDGWVGASVAGGLMSLGALAVWGYGTLRRPRRRETDSGSAERAAGRRHSTHSVTGVGPPPTDG
ncbi:MFS transporter [Streptomyces sp. TRM68367]|uniref:MFS transporter n=1 Tax=Streptomyces sp. TRM68367 TaxID=2758415 RepID=UPI0019959518|nr:MFS transporter [Streptomyces sp. TRM68367]MBC9725828.1 MFS transporter [Streptomyces sp. TRM68367]